MTRGTRISLLALTLACLSVVATALWLPPPSLAGVDRFSGGGPDGGSVQALAVGGGSRLYAVGGEGAWERAPSASRWQADLGELSRTHFLTAIAVGAGDSDFIYAGVDFFQFFFFGGEETLLTSRDGGRSWTSLTYFEGFYGVNRIAVDPRDPRSALVSSRTCPIECPANTLKRTTDGGKTWKAILSTDYPLSFAYDPVHAGTFYVVGPSPSPPYGQCLLRSDDGGESFSTLACFGEHTLLGSLAVGAGEEGAIYVGNQVAPDPTDGRVYRSLDGGATFLPEQSGLEGTRSISSVVADPVQPGKVWASSSGGGVFRSEDQGVTWTRVDAGLPPVGVYDLVVDPSQPQRLVAATGAGVYVNTEADRWEALNQGLHALPVADLTTVPGDGRRLVVAAGAAGGLASDDGGTTWRRLDRGWPGGGAAEAVAVEPATGGFLMGFCRSERFFLYGGLYRWLGEEQGWQLAGLDGKCVRDVEVVPGGRVLALVPTFDGGQVYSSADGREPFAPVQGLEGERVRELVASPTDASLFYALTDDAIFASGDGGSTWSARNSVSPRFHPALVVDSSGVASLYGLAGNELYAPGLSGWQKIAELPAGRIRTLIADPRVPNRLYAGTDEGVWESPNRGGTWRSLDPGLAGVGVDSLTWDAGRPGRLWAGTSRGILSIDLLDAPTVRLGDRFDLAVAWRDFEGHYGVGHPTALTQDTASVWFFGPDNLELFVKVLDGRVINDHFWVFYGALSNVEYEVTVSDRETGLSRTYQSPAGRFASFADTGAFEQVAGGEASSARPDPGAAAAPPRAAAVEETGGCQPGPEALCLAGGRFRVSVEWQDFQGGSGPGTAIPLTPDTGAFWYFGAENLELAVKVLDGRAINGRFWVFYGSLSNVAFTLRVEDTTTHEVRTYVNPSGTFASRGDTEAFSGL